MVNDVALCFSSSVQLALNVLWPHRHKPPQGSYNVFLCVQASIVYVSGNQQADEILISPNHVST